jgi:hypothetical protein
MRMVTWEGKMGRHLYSDTIKFIQFVGKLYG